VSVYSIKDLENLSNIKAHTLRIWEQRYNFLNPKRTETNIRYYDDNDLKLILNVSLLKDNGLKISKIARMSYDEIKNEVRRITDKNLRYPEQIHALSMSMLDLDEERFEKVISTNVLQLGFENTMINIIYPFLTKIGILWQTGTINPAHEHFISNLIKQKVIVAIDGQFSGNVIGKKYLLFLPEGELHEISILFSNYIIRARGNKVIYLGQSLPFSDLQIVYDIHKPDFIFSAFTTSPVIDEVENYIKKLSGTFSDSKILLTGFQVIGQNFTIPDNVIIINRIQDLIRFVESNR
jgi:MerR family transcriptional regulator, light-induced transcriptional regulator